MSYSDKTLSPSKNIQNNNFVSLNVHQEIRHALSKFLSYDNLSPTYQAYIAASLVDTEPSNYA